MFPILKVLVMEEYLVEGLSFSNFINPSQLSFTWKRLLLAGIVKRSSHLPCITVTKGNTATNVLRNVKRPGMSAGK